MSASVHTLRPPSSAKRVRRCVEGDDPRVFADIYEDDTNIVIWQRELTQALAEAADRVLAARPALGVSTAVTPESAFETVSRSIDADGIAEPLSRDVAELVDMFCCLFDIERAGLRLVALRQAMCPKFHVDRVPCRMVTTYRGVATEWLAHNDVDRSKLGLGSEGKPDRESGLYQNANAIRNLDEGAVAVLKGETWKDNEGAGLVHRSPGVELGDCRLLMTLDVIVD